MSSNCIRRMEPCELKNFYKHIKHDFPLGEYAPYAILHRQLINGNQEGLVFCSGSQDLAYSICAVNRENDYVLVSLFAVFDRFRGKGVGSEFIKAIGGRYSEMQGMIVEVEKPELSEDKKELETSRRRIAFYERAGFQLINGIDYVIWDVPMHLMALPLKADRETIESGIDKIMHDIYLKLIGKLFIGKLHLRKL